MAATSHLRDRTCPRCGETKMRKEFWGELRKPMQLCTKCRRSLKRREQYAAEKIRKAQADTHRAVSDALQQQREAARGTVIHGAVRELNILVSRVERRLRVLETRLGEGHFGPRTLKAIEYQKRKRAYYTEVREIMMRDAAEGMEHPLDYYLGNTHLLHKHGFPVIVVDDPLTQETEVVHDNTD